MWSTSVAHRILSSPLCAGTGYANRYYLAPSPDPRRRGRRPDDLTCRRLRPRGVDPDPGAGHHRRADA
jgi:hypothetical protein